MVGAHVLGMQLQKFRDPLRIAGFHEQAHLAVLGATVVAHHHRDRPKTQIASDDDFLSNLIDEADHRLGVEGVRDARILVVPRL